MKQFLLIFLSFLTFKLSAQIVHSENELLWEISGNGLKEKSYLFGSLHSNDKRLFQFPDSLYVALEKSKLIVLETDLFALFEEWDTRQDDIKLLFDNKGNPYTGSDKATKTIYGSEDGMPQFMDAWFLEYCYNAGKKFFPLEEVQDQLEMMNNWGRNESNVVGLDPMLITQEKMIEFYLNGDIVSIDRIMRVNLSSTPGMYDEIIVGRNKLMTAKLDSLIRRSASFCAVGAGHLAGDMGMINLLRLKGYKLRKITASFTEPPLLEKKSVKSKRQYSYVNDTIGVVALFPGKPKELKIWDNHPYLVYREMGQGNTYSIEIIPIDGSISLEEQAAIYIASPNGTHYHHLLLDDGTEAYQGLSDTYPEGVHWIRLVQSDQYLILMRAYGGNKFMNSNRPNLFFSKVWFE